MPNIKGFLIVTCRLRYCTVVVFHLQHYSIGVELLSVFHHNKVCLSHTQLDLDVTRWFLHLPSPWGVLVGGQPLLKEGGGAGTGLLK